MLAGETRVESDTVSCVAGSHICSCRNALRTSPTTAWLPRTCSEKSLVAGHCQCLHIVSRLWIWRLMLSAMFRSTTHVLITRTTEDGLQASKQLMDIYRTTESYHTLNRHIEKLLSSHYQFFTLKSPPNRRRESDWENCLGPKEKHPHFCGPPFNFKAHTHFIKTHTLTQKQQEHLTKIELQKFWEYRKISRYPHKHEKTHFRGRCA